MSTSSSQSEVMYEVVVSEEGQFSIWPMNKALPSGWTKAASQAGTKETCLEFIRGLGPICVRFRCMHSQGPCRQASCTASKD